MIEIFETCQTKSIAKQTNRDEALIIKSIHTPHMIIATLKNAFPPPPPQKKKNLPIICFLNQKKGIWKSSLKCLKKCLWTIKSITLTFITLLVHKAGLWEAAEKFGRGDEKALQYPAQERGRHLQVHIQPRVCTESPNPGPIVTKKLQRLSARIIDHHVAMDITNNQENESRYIRLTLVKRIERTDKAICRVRVAQKIYMR